MSSRLVGKKKTNKKKFRQVDFLVAEICSREVKIIKKIRYPIFFSIRV